MYIFYTKKDFVLTAISFFIGCGLFAMLHSTVFALQMKNSGHTAATEQENMLLMAESDTTYACAENVIKKFSIDVEKIDETKAKTSPEETTEVNEIMLSMKSNIDEHLSSVKKAKEQKEKEKQEMLKRQEEEKKKEAEEKAKKETTKKPQKKNNTPSRSQKATKAAGGIKITAAERDLLERLVEAEASGEPYEGKLAVATVVINRLNSKQFPNTIKGVIYQKNQFSPVSNGNINRKASADSKKAVRQVVDEGYRSFSPEVVYFLNPKIATSKWIIRNRTYVTTIGNHAFYK